MHRINPTPTGWFLSQNFLVGCLVQCSEIHSPILDGLMAEQHPYKFSDISNKLSWKKEPFKNKSAGQINPQPVGLGLNTVGSEKLGTIPPNRYRKGTKLWNRNKT